MRRYVQRDNGSIVHHDDTPEMLLMEAMIAGDPSRMIENQERQGQRQVAGLTMLPRDGTIGGEHMREARAAFEAVGVQFHEPIDDLFVRVTLPEGWKIQPTDHAMWNNLLDEQDRKVTSFFYKAAFYDRSAHIFAPKPEAEREPV